MMASHGRAVRHPLVTVAWVLVVTVVIFYTMGKAYVSVPGLWDAAVQSRRELRLVPFDEFSNPTLWYGPWVNLFSNVGLFLPVGFLAGDLRRGVMIGFAFSLGIEVAQFVIAAGYTDIDDLVFNTAGAALGGWAAAKMPTTAWSTTLWVIVAGAVVLILPFLSVLVA